MKILIIGGAGYIGSVVAQLLLDSGHTVTIYDNLQKGYLAAIPSAAQLIEGDILDRAALDAAMRATTYDAIIHFAALIEAGESMHDPNLYFRNNVTGSSNLIEAAVANHIPRIVFSSSAGVYASKDTPLTEQDPIGSSSVYGETKYMIERVLHWNHQIHGLRYAALRYFNAAGAVPGKGEAHRPETHLIPLTLQVALGQRKQIAIYGDDYPTPDGTCIRDYIHIADLASAHKLALEALDERPVMVYNLGNGTGYSVRQVIETARQVTGHPIPAITTPRRPGDAARLVADASLIHEQLGWQPQIPDLADIVASAWEWHQSHPNGYDETTEV